MWYSLTCLCLIFAQIKLAGDFLRRLFVNVIQTGVRIFYKESLIFPLLFLGGGSHLLFHNQMLSGSVKI